MYFLKKKTGYGFKSNQKIFFGLGVLGFGLLFIPEAHAIPEGSTLAILGPLKAEFEKLLIYAGSMIAGIAGLKFCWELKQQKFVAAAAAAGAAVFGSGTVWVGVATVLI